MSNIKFKLVNIAIRNKTLLTRWTKDILVMLKKKPGVINMSKLRIILLLEADFNGLNKIIFNSRLILIMERAYAIPYEIIGR